MRIWERQHDTGRSATVSEVEWGGFAADCHILQQDGRIETQRLGVFPSVVQAKAAADIFFRDLKHECSTSCGAWTEAVVAEAVLVDEEKGRLQEGLIRRLAGEHAGHADFWLRTFPTGGVQWQCSCDKAKSRPS